MATYLPVLSVVVLLLLLTAVWGFQTWRDNRRKPQDRFDKRITPYGGIREIARRKAQLERGIIKEN